MSGPVTVLLGGYWDAPSAVAAPYANYLWVQLGYVSAGPTRYPQAYRRWSTSAWHQGHAQTGLCALLPSHFGIVEPISDLLNSY